MTPFADRGGRGVRVAVIDSGVNAAHPHIAGVADGVTIGETTEPHLYPDLLGHGTAVMAAIQEKAPEAEYFAVRVFYSSLRTHVEYLLRAIEWCIEHDSHVVNLSLGTANPNHAPRFEPLIAHAAERGVLLVSARDAGGLPALPGSLPGVISVGLDWDCPRESYRCRRSGDSLELYASGYPRSLPDMSKERNLHGISFAVANMTGFVARACEGLPSRRCEIVQAVLAGQADCLMEPAAR
jgi:subtilisin family serine protease